VTKLENGNVNPKIGVDMNLANKIQEIFDEIKKYQL
jgi:DNA-binding XRE family transcriptional regulator